MGKNGKRKISPQVLIALITAIGTILVAIIGIVPSLISKSNSSSTVTPKINFVANKDNLYTVGGSSFTFNTNNQIDISGSFDKPIYANIDLPKNFSATISFQTKSEDTEFSIGLGNGQDWGPNYRFRFSKEGLSFKKATTNDFSSDETLEKDNSLTLSPNTVYVMVFERIDGVAKLFINNTVWKSIGDEIDGMNQMSRLYITTNLGEVSIEQFVVEEK